MINEKMREDLINLGLKPDDTILMHSSLSSLGYVEGGAETVIDTLLSILNDGTLLIPTLSYEIVHTKNPIFSVNDTPSCVGAISEYFRKREGVIRSIHPTHSVCGIGKYAKEILSEHINTNTPAGELSPFGLLPKYDGKVLMLGCGLRPNTSMHAIEETVEPWFLYKKELTEFTLYDKDGNKIVKEYKCHNFSHIGQRYDRLLNVMDINTGRVLNADCYLIPALQMWETAKKYLQENEEYFVERL